VKSSLDSSCSPSLRLTLITSGLKAPAIGSAEPASKEGWKGRVAAEEEQPAETAKASLVSAGGPDSGADQGVQMPLVE